MHDQDSNWRDRAGLDSLSKVEPLVALYKHSMGDAVANTLCPTHMNSAVRETSGTDAQGNNVTGTTARR